MRITEAEAKRQYLKIKKRGWLPYFQEAAKQTRETTSLWLGIGSRETNLENIRGDYHDGKYHGFGVVQVDVGTDPSYAKNWSKDNVKAGIVKGSIIFNQKREDTLDCVDKKVKVRTKSFTGRKVEDDDLRRICIAAYNCGRWAHYHFSQIPQQNMDSTTSGKDYSRDVMDRAVLFAKFLDEDGTEPGALKREINRHGKYVLAEHAKLIGLQVTDIDSDFDDGEMMDDEDNLSRVTYRYDDAEDLVAVGIPNEEDEHHDDSKLVEVKTKDETPIVTVQQKVEVPGTQTSNEPQLPVPEKTTPVVAVAKQKVEALVSSETLESAKQSLMTNFKARALAIPSAIMMGLSAFMSWLKAANPIIVILLIVGFILIVGGFIWLVIWLKNRDRDRALELERAKLELQMQRERQAHELNILQGQTAAAANKFTVNYVE